ncbi:MarR family transcriptional regulator [Aeromonas veronii]|uniref:hypothetical protein n=1 Tax=Aeromonas veronii TaxID=654 RepID=UPI001C5ACE1D|nr:hypothetical protein [Aeromonas veronii]MBW3781238.1 MarR family transcriptional regulator [Aeromonas veronii]
MIYHDWGFNSSPFQTTSLPPTQLGEKLLVGRDPELASLMRKIVSPPKLATVEGLNGVGKTSVVNIACYRLFCDHITNGSGQLYIPCRKIFQLNPNQDVQTFIDSVLMEVAQTLIESAEELKERGLEIKSENLNRWLNSPQLKSYQAGLWVVQGGIQSETNTSAGFERSGFRKTVFSWLEQIFPNHDGGIICTIDNLELLQSSDTARSLLEQLRDELFNVTGLRWVLCGALGIVYGVVASPRLEGYLHKPIEVNGINASHAQDILRTRIESYSKNIDTHYLPLTPPDFAELYAILRGNLRSVLSYSDDYCQWIADSHIPHSDEEKHDAFCEWLNEQARTAYDAVRQELRPRAIEVFKKSIDTGGIFSPSDYEEFGFNSIAAFRPHIRDLESVGLLVSTQDEGDKRRKTIQITPKGWMVNLHLPTL